MAQAQTINIYWKIMHLCDTQQLEDEYHFILGCKGTAISFRDIFLNKTVNGQVS